MRHGSMISPVRSLCDVVQRTHVVLGQHKLRCMRRRWVDNLWQSFSSENSILTSKLRFVWDETMVDECVYDIMLKCPHNKPLKILENEVGSYSNIECLSILNMQHFKIYENRYLYGMDGWMVWWVLLSPWLNFYALVYSMGIRCEWLINLGQLEWNIIDD